MKIHIKGWNHSSRKIRIRFYIESFTCVHIVCKISLDKTQNITICFWKYQADKITASKSMQFVSKARIEEMKKKWIKDTNMDKQYISQISTKYTSLKTNSPHANEGSCSQCPQCRLCMHVSGPLSSSPIYKKWVSLQKLWNSSIQII